jgi:molecular chaperone GrpE
MTETPQDSVHDASHPEAEAAEQADLAQALQDEIKKRSALEEEILRMRAEADNVRRRMQREMDQARKYGADKVLGDMLPIIDALESGLRLAEHENASVASLREGKEMSLKMLLKVLDQHGLKQVHPIGESFNPEFHQAVAMVPAAEGQTSGSVVLVMQTGYVLADRLLRPALVSVAS